MNKFIILAVLVLAAFAEFQEDGDVLILTDANFDEAIAKYEFILVEFYAPWCGHCKKLAPLYSKAAKVLKSAATPVPLAKVDATENSGIADRFSIQGFPTLKFFNNGQEIEYNGGRTDKDIIAWVTKRVGSVSSLINSVEEFEKFTKANQVAIIYFGGSESDENFGVFKSVAMGYEKLGFAHCFDADVIAHAKTESGKVVLFKQFDEGRNDFNEAFVNADLKKFIDGYSFATLMEFDDRAIEKVFQEGNPTFFLFHTSSDESVEARKQFEAAAKQLKGGKVLFAVSRPDDDHGHFQRLADYVGINTAKVPALMLVHAGTGDINKYQFSGEITQDRVVSFVEDYTNDKLEKYLKTEEIPEKNDGPVKTLVGKNFQDEVINNDKDVLVKFYAPWCGHCKSLAPKWEAAAEKLKHNKNIVIADCDSTANEVPGVAIKGFPTIKFFSGKNKQTPIDFEGDRTEEGIIAWLKEHTSHPWVESSDDKKDDL